VLLGEDLQGVVFPLSLAARPKIVACGPTTHGLRGAEDYVLDQWSLHLYHGYKEGTTVTLTSVPRNCAVDLPKGSALPMTFPIRNGAASLFPPRVGLTYNFTGRCSHNYVLFDLPQTAGTRQSMTSILAMQDLGERFAPLNQALEEGFAMFGTNPLRAEIRVWDVLWAISSDQPVSPWLDNSLPPVMRRALQLIEARLAEPLVVPSFAHELGISHNQLLRLFHNCKGTTVLGWLRQRRVERAVHLLRFTSASIKDIAQQVGLPDLHHFNKIMRKEKGLSPRQLRA
jgi:AraC family transcriptional regulator